MCLWYRIDDTHRKRFLSFVDVPLLISHLRHLNGDHLSHVVWIAATSRLSPHHVVGSACLTVDYTPGGFPALYIQEFCKCPVSKNVWNL